MVTAVGKLTALKVKRAAPGRHVDGDGLCLVVSETGARKWVLRIQVSGKRKDIGLGSAKTVDLAAARALAFSMRQSYKRGEDPLLERRKAKDTIPTFSAAAMMVFEEHKPSWKNSKHAAQWLSTLKTYVFPMLGDLPVNQIDGPMVRDVLAEIWLTIPETARRVRQRIGTVLDFAHAKGWREAEAPMRSVTKGLPKQPKGKSHHSAMPWQKVPDFVSNLSERLSAGETVLLAIEFLILTAARSGEVRGARWSEFDLEAKCWDIPPERMKAGEAHRVPLSDRAVEILHRMSEFRRIDKRDGLVFEGHKQGKMMSDMTLTMPLRRAEIDATIHGFRSSFRDWVAEGTKFQRELAEKALAHKLGDATEAAYQRGDMLEKRRELMGAWAEFLQGDSPDLRIIHLERHISK